MKVLGTEHLNEKTEPLLDPSCVCLSVRLLPNLSKNKYLTIGINYGNRILLF